MKRVGFLLASPVMILLIISSACELDRSARIREKLPEFENRLERFRQDFDIPGFSAAIAVDSEVIWSKGFGLADVERRIPATDTTAYLMASVTKPFASTIIMRLVEEGKLDLETPVSRYGLNLDTARARGATLTKEDSIKVRHLLTHTAEGKPGSRYRYNGFLFSLLDSVVEKASGETFGQLVMERIVRPLGLRHTAPNICDSAAFALSGFDSSTYTANLAKGYTFDSLGRVTECPYERYFGVAAGLMSSAVDVARYSMAMDDDKFLKPQTKEMAYRPTISTEGDTLPYGLGWFTDEYNGVRYVWHYGLWRSNSSLLIKIPGEKLTFVVLSNSNAMTLPTELGQGYLLTSQVATDFLRTFVFTDEDIPVVDYNQDESKLVIQLASYSESKHREWLIKQLFGMSRFYYLHGKQDQMDKMMRVYNKAYARPMPDMFAGSKVLARIDSVENDAKRSVDFTLPRASIVRVFSVGEAVRRMVDFGWIENIATDEIVWEMKYEETSHAGGAIKNRVSDREILLPAGRYRLKYMSDDSHAYMMWNEEPPEYDFYGIAVCETGKSIQ